MPTFDELRDRDRVSTGQALALYDGLDPVSTEFMLGTWRGDEFPTGHEMDGLLAASGWYGKRFDGPDAVHPLLFHTADRRAVFPCGPGPDHDLFRRVDDETVLGLMDYRAFDQEYFFVLRRDRTPPPLV